MENLADLYHISHIKLGNPGDVVDLIPSQPKNIYRKNGVYATFLGWVNTWTHALDYAKFRKLNKDKKRITPLYNEEEGFYLYQLVDLNNNDNCFYGLDNFTNEEYIETKVSNLKKIEDDQDNHAYRFNALEIVFEKPMKAKLIGKLIAHKQGYSKVFNKYHWDEGVVKKTTEIADDVLEVVLY